MNGYFERIIFRVVASEGRICNAHVNFLRLKLKIMKFLDVLNMYI